eukprot:1497882-Pyramimonas_sp.AAC.1
MSGGMFDWLSGFDCTAAASVRARCEQNHSAPWMWLGHQGCYDALDPLFKRILYRSATMLVPLCDMYP